MESKQELSSLKQLCTPLSPISTLEDLFLHDNHPRGYWRRRRRHYLFGDHIGDKVFKLKIRYHGERFQVHLLL